MGGEGREKGKQEPARWPMSLPGTLQWFLRLFLKSLNSWTRIDELELGCDMWLCGN